MMSIRVPEVAYERLQGYADDWGIPPATMVRMWVMFHTMMMDDGSPPLGGGGKLPPRVGTSSTKPHAEPLKDPWGK